MMAGKGGYQRPTSPAPVSGPGSLSQRTDGGPGQAARYVPGMAYGEGKELMEMQTSAPMEAAPKTPSASGARAGVAQAVGQQPVVPLNAPTQMPHLPVTDGAPLGPGAGPESLGIGAVDQSEQDAARARIQSYRPVLNYLASRPDTSPETRMFIRQLMSE